MKSLLAVLLVVLNTAAVPPPMPPPGPPPDTILTRFITAGRKVVSDTDALREIMRVFNWSGPDSSWNFPEDAQYIKPSAEDVAEFIAYFQAHHAREKYESQSWDCDDTAREGLYWGRLWGHQKYKGVQAAAMIGAAYVKVINEKTPSYHVLNFIGQSDGTWFFFEPQQSRLISLEEGLKQYKILKMQF